MDLFQAAISQFQAKKDRALANLYKFQTSAVQIGEHSDLVLEVESWIDELATAESCIDAIKKHF